MTSQSVRIAIVKRLIRGIARVLGFDMVAFDADCARIEQQLADAKTPEERDRILSGLKDRLRAHL